MEKIKTIFKNDKKFIEGLFVSLISGWIFSALARGVCYQISFLNYYASFDIISAVIILGLSAAIVAVIYSWKNSAARLIMFGLLFLFTLMCAYNGTGVQWETNLFNPIGNIYFDAVLCFVTVMAFLYVKDDIFKILKQETITNKQLWIITAVFGVLIFAFVGSTTVLRYVTYSNTTFDFGIFAQMYEYMKQKGVMDTTVERNYLLSHFGVHFSPVFYLGLPIYFIFSSPITVQLIQALMIALPLIPIVLLCRHYKLSNWITFAVLILYMLYPATTGGAFYDIHENCFLTFFLLMTIWAIEKNKNTALAIFTLLTFSVKEDAAVYIMVLGAYFFFSRRDKKRGIILMIISLIYFVITVSIVNSFGLGVLDDRFDNLYFDSNGGMFQIIETIILNPAYVLGQSVANAMEGSHGKIQYLMLMIIPMAGVLFTTGKKYSRYILMSPFIVLNVITTYLYLHDIRFQYNFGIIALFLYIVIMNLSDMKNKKAKVTMCVSVICTVILFTGEVFPDLIYYAKKYQYNKGTITEMNKALKTLPEEASVSASKYLIAHLSKHLELYDQRNAENIIYTDYIVIDRTAKEYEDYFDEMLNSGQYQSVYEVDGVVSIYQKKE